MVVSVGITHGGLRVAPVDLATANVAACMLVGTVLTLAVCASSRDSKPSMSSAIQNGITTLFWQLPQHRSGDLRVIRKYRLLSRLSQSTRVYACAYIVDQHAHS